MTGVPGTGKSTVADAVGQLPAVLEGVARGEEIALCRQLADEEGRPMLLVATECSDVDLHRRRTEGRQRSIPGW